MYSGRRKSGSWANLRALSVNLRDHTHSSSKGKHAYVDESSNSFEDSQIGDYDKTWEETLAFKCFSQSVLPQHSAVAQAEAGSCDNTPPARRRSVKRIIEKFGVAGNVTHSHADKANVPNKKAKTASKRDTVYFNLYSDAIEQNIFSNDELEIWNIQERFPNDDLRLYEGVFTIDGASGHPISPISPSPSEHTLSPAASPIAVPVNFMVDPSKGRISQIQEEAVDFGDVPRSPAVPRKMATARATVHPINAFRADHHHHSQQQAAANFAARFPAFSRLSPALQAKFKKMAQRRQSAPSIVLRGVLGRGIKPPSALYNRDEGAIPYSPNVNNQRRSLKFGSTGATLNLSKRKYVMEGKVQLTTGMQTQDRYLFLFTDLLLIAKAKSGSNYKLKYRIRVCELWIAACLDDVCELPKSTDKSFVMGWPTTNCVATFSTPESKESWLNALLKQVHEEKEMESPKTLSMKIINRDSSNNSHAKMVEVTHRQTAREVARMAVKEFGFEESAEDEYQLWVMSRKEGTAYPLIGHENPHAIQLSHIRDFISSNGILQETEITSVERYQNLIQPDIRDRCQFILRNSHQSPSSDMTQKRLSRLKAKTPTSIFNWARKRSGQRNESSDSGHVSGNSVGSEGTTFFSSSPPSTSPPTTPKLFSLPLGQVCENGELPAPIASMLDILYRKAPYASGIFRKSANAKTTRQLKRKLDEEAEIDIDDASIHVIAALVKDFLRNIPDSVLDCLLYPKWTEAIDLESDEAKINCMRNLLFGLDSCNRVLIRRLAIVLNRIASRSDRNNMTAYNLAVCIAPSLLWPPGPTIQTEAPIKVTEILQYFTERCHDIFDGIAPTDIDWPPEISFKSDDDDDYEGDNEKSTGTFDGSVSPISDVPPTQKSGEQEQRLNNEEKEDESDVNHFNRSRMTRRQLQRRKPGSNRDSARLISLSQDSLDRIVDNDTLSQAVDDMLNGGDLHHNHHIQQRGRNRGRDACSMSNDSGFTTLSGEEEENPSSSYRRTLNEGAIAMSSSTGSKLNDLDENIGIASEELRNLWVPSLLNISNGQIMEDGLDGIKEELPEMANSYSGYGRRQSQPVMPMRQRSHGSSLDSASGHKSSHPFSNNSRLVAAITSPTIEYDEVDDEMTSSFLRQPPKYVRLNDRSDDTPKHDGLAKEYLRQLREQRTDDVRENIAKTVTSPENKTQYLSGVKVTVNDVRPPEVRQYRPVTLSIRGITNSQTSPTGFNENESSATSDDKNFFIREENSSGSTPDGLNSSQEDVFKGWDSRSPFANSRGRSNTAPERHEIDAPMTAPLSRRYNSSRTPRKVELDLSFTPPATPVTECMSPIQKLTENLQMLPDFRQHKTPLTTKQSVPDNYFFGRNKSSSVREGRLASKSSVPTHYIKSKHHLRTGDTQGLIGTSFKANTGGTTGSSRSSVSDVSRSSIDSSSRNSLNDASPASPKEGGCFERDVKTRRPYGRRRYNLSSKMTTKSGGEDGFSKSLPSSDWKNLKDDSRNLSQRESSRESVKSDITGSKRHDDVNHDVTDRLKQASSKLRETDIIHMAGAVESRIRQLSSSPCEDPKDTSTSQQEFRVRSGSVKSKVTAFNHLNKTTPSPNSNSSNSPVEFVIRDANEEFRVKRKNLIPTPSSKTSNIHVRQHQDILPTKLSPDVIKMKIEDSGRNGLIIRATPDSLARKTTSDAVSVHIHPADAKSSSHRTSPQPISDNLLFTLSESFAFGNRKSPRNITPISSPRDSPIFVRRRRGGTHSERRTTPSNSTNSSQQPERRTRHLSVDHDAENKPRTNVHVASWSVKRKSGDGETPRSHHPRPLDNNYQKPPFSPTTPTRDKNSNEILPPFIGFEKVIHSEESYV